MQAGVGLLDTDVMPILHNHCLGYRHNFALFYQLHDSCSPIVLFAFMREASSKTYGPRVYFPSYKFSIYYFAIFYFPVYKPKIQKIFTLPFVWFHLSLLDITFASDREGIDNPFIALGASCLIVYAGIGDLCVVSYWIDTLVL